MVKKIFYLLTLFIFLVGCDSTYDSSHTESVVSGTNYFSNDFLDTKKESDFEIINLDYFQNFGQLIEQMQMLSCENKTIGLSFNHEETTYNLLGYTECPTSGIIACYFNQNSVHIKNDSLKNLSGDWNKMVHLKKLGDELKKMKDVDDYHSLFGRKTLKPVLINIYIDDKHPISKTKEVLAQVVREFETSNSKMGENYYRYRLLFEGYSITDIPPPPPPPDLPN